MGRLVPAGTGMSIYRKLGIKVEGYEDSVLEEQQISEKNIEKNLDSQVVN
jgi:hypothetical protein